METGERQHVVEAGLRPRIDVDHRPGRTGRIAGRRRPRMDLDRAVVRRPGQRRRRVEHQVELGLAGVGVVVAPPFDPVRRMLGCGLVPEALLGDPVGIAMQVHRSTCEIRQHHRCDVGVVADQIALRDRRVRTVRREQHLVEVRQVNGVLAELPVARLASAPRDGRVRRRSEPTRSCCSTSWRRVPPSPRRWSVPT